jgi:hypothetical protein
MKKLITICVALLAGAAAFASGAWDYGANRVIGSGNVRSESRTVPSFTAIEVEGSGTVTLSQGIVQSFSVETDDNVMDLVKTEVVGGVLHLGFVHDVSIGRLTRLAFRITAPRIDGIVISGSGDVHAATVLRTSSLSLEIRGSGSIDASVNTDSLQTHVGGSGGINVAGSARDLSVTIDGSGSVRARDLESGTANVRINGSGGADVTVQDTIMININGSGDVSYGGGAKATVRSSGSGTARQR